MSDVYLVKRDDSTVRLEIPPGPLQYSIFKPCQMATLPEILLSRQRHGRNCAVRRPVLVEVVGNIADHIVKDA